MVGVEVALLVVVVDVLNEALARDVLLVLWSDVGGVRSLNVEVVEEDVSLSAIALFELLLASELPTPPPTAAATTMRATAPITIMRVRFDKPQYDFLPVDLTTSGESLSCCNRYRCFSVDGVDWTCFSL